MVSSALQTASRASLAVIDLTPDAISCSFSATSRPSNPSRLQRELPSTIAALSNPPLLPVDLPASALPLCRGWHEPILVPLRSKDDRQSARRGMGTSYPP